MDPQPSKKQDRRLKRSRTERLLPANKPDLSANPWFPKFLIVQSDDQSLEKMSPFIIAKDLEKLVGKSYSAKKLRTGGIQVEVESKQQSDALLTLKKIGEIPVSVSSHRTLNIVKGVISEDDLLGCSESELEEGLKEHGVTAAKRIILRRDGKEVPTKHIVLSFKLHVLPSTVKAGYINCHVRAYVPNPRRCFNCQRFGHSSQVCRGQMTCPKCASQGHTPESCRNEVQCANCKGRHPVYSRSCPRWQEEKQILRIKTENNLTYKAAKAQYDFAQKGTFSDVVRRGVAPHRKSVDTQTCWQDLACSQCTPQPKVGDTEVAPLKTVACNDGGRKDIATTSSEVDGTLSAGARPTKAPAKNHSYTMEVDDDECTSQKPPSGSSVSLPLSREKRDPGSGRGRGSKATEQQKQRVKPP